MESAHGDIGKLRRPAELLKRAGKLPAREREAGPGSNAILRWAVAQGMTTPGQEALEETKQGHLDLTQVPASSP